MRTPWQLMYRMYISFFPPSKINPPITLYLLNLESGSSWKCFLFIASPLSIHHSSHRPPSRKVSRKKYGLTCVHCRLQSLHKSLVLKWNDIYPEAMLINSDPSLGGLWSPRLDGLVLEQFTLSDDHFQSSLISRSVDKQRLSVIKTMALIAVFDEELHWSWREVLYFCSCASVFIAVPVIAVYVVVVDYYFTTDVVVVYVCCWFLSCWRYNFNVVRYALAICYCWLCLYC